MSFYQKTKVDFNFTVWKFQDFSVIQILCEINFGESRTLKSATFAALNFFNLVLVVAFKKCKNSKSKFRPSKCAKMADFALLKLSKLISRKIRLIFT